MKKQGIVSLSILFALALTGCKQEAKTQEAVQTEVTAPAAETPVVEQSTDKPVGKEELEKPYNEQEDGAAKLQELIAQAKAENKRVFVQAGGNWCIWCLRFHDFIQKNPEVKQLVDDNYVYYNLNYSTKNKNEEAFKKYVPDAKGLGYPFFFVIDGEGKVTNVIASGDLEAEKSYDLEKVKQLFKDNTGK